MSQEWYEGIEKINKMCKNHNGYDKYGNVICKVKRNTVERINCNYSKCSKCKLKNFIGA